MLETHFQGIKNPLEELRTWLEEAEKTPLNYPNAVTLSTYNPKTQNISSRVVLLKKIEEENLIFYTNYLSEKGRDLSEFSKASLSFYWDILHRQINLKGDVERVDPEDSKNYWETRSRKSQISQYLSKQSEPVQTRRVLEEAFKKLEKKFEGQPVPYPQNWGGYKIKPFEIEFWIEKKHRLHDRFQFQKSDQGDWSMKRLYP